MKIRHVTTQEARLVGQEIGIDWNEVDLEQFRRGMEVEFEHGLIDEQTNITNDNPLLTGKIALAHLKELPDYYTRLEKMEQNQEEYQEAGKPHYYGNTIRKLFLVSALIMVISLPFAQTSLNLPVSISIVAILILAAFAGIISPRLFATVEIDTVVAALGFLTFEYFGVKSYSEHNAFFFVINQILAALFLFAAYFGVKNWRGMLTAR